MFCPTCGSNLSENAAVCTSCGKQLRSGPANKALIVALVGFLIAMGAGLAVFFLGAQ